MSDPAPTHRGAPSHYTDSPRIRWLRENVCGEHILDIGFVGERDLSVAHRAVAESNSDAVLIGFDRKPSVADRALDEGIRGDLYSIPLADKCVDAVVFAEVLEHLTRPFAALEELFRVLEPGGKLYLTTPNGFGVYRYLRHYFFAPQRDPAFYLGAEDHTQFFDPLSLRRLAGVAGFEHLQTDFRNVTLPKVPSLPDWSVLRRFPLDRLGSYICMVLQRPSP